MNTIVALDRDGVILYCPKDFYVNTVKDVRFINGSINAIVNMQKYGLMPVIVTNQAGLALGHLTETEYAKINHIIQSNIIKQGGCFVPTFTCPHKKEDFCGCRKPQAGLLYKAEGKFNGSVEYMVGDYWTDIEAGHRVGATTILTCTGRGMDEENIKHFENTDKIYDICVQDLLEASEYIIASYLKKQLNLVGRGVSDGYDIYKDTIEV